MLYCCTVLQYCIQYFILHWYLYCNLSISAYSIILRVAIIEAFLLFSWFQQSRWCSDCKKNPPPIWFQCKLKTWCKFIYSCKTFNFVFTLNMHPILWGWNFFHVSTCSFYYTIADITLPEALPSKVTLWKLKAWTGGMKISPRILLLLTFQYLVSLHQGSPTK